jgi:hypothetical protein
MTDSPLTDTYGSARRPDRPPAHTRPAGMSDKTVRALGSLTAALEVAEHARDGHDSVWMAHRDSAWLFDVDGTLVDSNYLHVVAWLEAFAALDRPVEAWRIHRRIGMDSGRLLAELLVRTPIDWLPSRRPATSRPTPRTPTSSDRCPAAENCSDTWPMRAQPSYWPPRRPRMSSQFYDESSTSITF